MSRTPMSGATHKPLMFPSGNWECFILGRVARLMGTPHYDDLGKNYDGDETDPEWFYSCQPYQLDGAACKEFAQALINVTDEVVETIHPHSPSFKGTVAELKTCIVYFGHMYSRLTKGYYENGDRPEWC